MVSDFKVLRNGARHFLINFAFEFLSLLLTKRSSLNRKLNFILESFIKSKRLAKLSPNLPPVKHNVKTSLFLENSINCETANLAASSKLFIFTLNINTSEAEVGIEPA